MSGWAKMPLEHWRAALDAAREKAGISRKLLSGELAGVIQGIVKPSGAMKITANGTYDVTGYAYVIIDIPTSPGQDIALTTGEDGSIAVSGVELTVQDDGAVLVGGAELALQDDGAVLIK